jgi:hypothetical protein
VLFSYHKLKSRVQVLEYCINDQDLRYVGHRHVHHDVHDLEERQVVGEQKRIRKLGSAPTGLCPKHQRWHLGPLLMSRTPQARIPMQRGKAIRQRSIAGRKDYLDVSSSAIQIEMEILNFSELCKLVLDIFFGSLLVNIGYEDDPSFYS